MTSSSTVETTQRVATRLGRLHVRTIGNGAPAVLWPSMFVDGHTWDSMIPSLATERTLFIVDGPGLGLSDPLDRPTNIATAALAGLDLLDRLELRTNVDWVGNAFGGHVGMKLAAAPGRLRSLIAISSPVEPVPANLRLQIHALLPLVRRFGPVGPARSASVRAMLTDASAADHETRQVVLDSLGRPTSRSLALAIRSFILHRIDVTNELAHICVPSLFVASDDRGDWSPHDAARSASLTPDARAITIPQARTLVPLEQPARLAEAVRAFWGTTAS